MNTVKDKLFLYFLNNDYSEDLDNHIKDILIDKIHKKYQQIFEEELKQKLHNKLTGDFDE